MSSIIRKKWFWILLGCTFLAASSVLFVQWSKKSHLVDFQLKEHKQKYIALQDSIQNLNYSLRENPPAHIATLQKDRISLFQSQAKQLREKISNLSKDNKSQLASSPQKQTSVAAIIKKPWAQVSLYTIAGIFILILVLLIILKKRKAQGSKLKVPPIPPPASSGESTDLEQLLSQLQTQAPIAKAKSSDRASKPSARSQVSHQEPLLSSPEELKASAPLENLANNPSTISSVDKTTDASPIPSKQVTAAVKNPLAPSDGESIQASSKDASNLFPSSLNRFDREDKQKSDVLKLARRGYTSSEIARRLKVSQDQVDFIIKLQREKG